MSKITDIRRAARLAKATASDIKIYNEDRIIRGLENDRLMEELEDDLREGFAMWESKVSEEIAKDTNLFQRALVDELFAAYSHIRSPIF